MDVLARTTAAAVDALRDPAKLPGALILWGVVEAAAALSLAFFTAPGGVLLGHGGMAPIYYSILAVVMVFGLAEASVGFWVSGNPRSRRAVGMTVLLVGILPTIVVAGLGGFASAAVSK